MLYTITLNPAVDKVVEITGILEREQNNKIKKVLYDIGGKGCHVSTVFSALGIPSIATGFTGGTNGEKLKGLMEAKNIKCEFVNVENMNTRECTILVDESNLGSFMITESGEIPGKKSYAELLMKIKKDIKEEDIVALSGSPAGGTPKEQYLEVVKALKETKAKIFIDARDEYLKEITETAPFFIKPNKHEFRVLTGKNLENTKDYIEEIKKLMEKINMVVVSLGDEGCIAGVKGEGIYRVVPPAVNVVSETGCGDIFVGGVISQYYLKKNTEDILRFATAISASKATHFLSSDFSLSQAEQFLSQIKVTKYE
jgi:1-phosphofructokinase